MFKVAVNENPIKDIIERTISPTARKRLFRYIGVFGSRKSKDNARKNSKGGKFWHEIANSVDYEYSEDYSLIGSTHYAAAHKHYGGRIEAPGKGEMSTNAKFLTIPISESAKGNKVSDFKRKELFRIVSKKGNPIIARKDGNGGIEPLFVMVKAVEQKPEPWFPEGYEMDNVLDQAVNEWKK